MSKLQEINGTYFLSIPKRLVQHFGWKKGTNLEVLQTSHQEKRLIVEESIPGSELDGESDSK